MTSLIFIFFFQIFISIDSIFCGICKNVENLLTTTCYNDVIIFNNKNWRAGHATTNKQKLTIIEYSLEGDDGKSRLFFGLKENGRHYFSNTFKVIDTMDCQGCSTNYRGRYESRNLFVSLKEDTGKTKQYLFSMSSYHSLVELIDLDDEDNFNYLAWDTKNFFSLDRSIFSLEFSLFEIGDSNTYITAFIESAGEKPDEHGDNKEYSDTTTILKFQLDNYASSSHRTISEKKIIQNTYNGRCVSAFRFDVSGKIVLIFVESTGEKTGKYIVNFYDDNLSFLGNHSIYDNVQNLWVGFGIFIKGISIKNDYAAFAFYHDGNNDKSLVWKTVQYLNNNYFTYKFEYLFNSYHFNEDVDTNGLYKLEDERIVLLTTEVIYKDGNTDNKADSNLEKYTKLHMFLFDFYNNYDGYKIREYVFSYTNKRFAKEIAAYMYNGYVILCTTLNNSEVNSIFSALIIFGFGNGTDHEIDISPYLMDTGYYTDTNNLYTYLINNMSIDNNIFGYEKVEKIRLVKICDELKLYKGRGANKEENPLPLNELFDADHTLLQNKDITKEENKLYTLEYQCLVKEPDYDSFYDSPKNTMTVSLDDNTVKSNYYHPKTLNGRTNILKFKLCHKYCINCKEFGISDNDQRCDDCKESYTYDYLAAMNNFTGNCVPQGYMYDFESKQLQICENNQPYKFYLNASRSNEKYCFKYMYDCPPDYHFLNETNNQCIDYTQPSPNPTEELEDNPSTEFIEYSSENPTEKQSEKPSTILTDAPTEEPTEKPRTIFIEEITDNPTEQPTERPTEGYTTIITESPTEGQTTIITERPTEKITTIITERPTEKHTTIITEKLIETTNKENGCFSGSLLNETCRNLTNQDLYNGIKEEVLSRFPPNGKSVVYEGKQGYNFQVTTTQNEIESLKNNNTGLTVIHLGDCEEKLKSENEIEGDLPLIIFKFYKDTELASQKEMQFEVYDPYTYKRLNLSICQNINLYVPVDLSQDPNVYHNIVDQGYDPFNINDKFYREICTQYSSENGTDVILDAREEYYYSPIVNETSCQGNCHYSSYSLDTKYLICECDVNDDGIVTLDVKHFNEKNVAYSFYSSLKLSNYKVVICYNLVFNFKVFCHNYGSIISTVFLGAYVVSMILYALRTINPLRVEISRFLFETGEVDNPLTLDTQKINLQRDSSKRKTTAKSKKANKNNNNDKSLPPKRSNTNSQKNSRNNKNSKDSLINESSDLKGSKTKSIRIAPNHNDIVINNKYSSNIWLNKQDKSGFSLISKHKKIDSKEKKDKNDKKEKNEDKKKEEEILDPDLLDNYEFNNLEYEQACEYDRRSFCRTYISVLMREELVLFTFFSCKDYNLFYVKLARFFILACTSMTFNALFFFHKTMYKKRDIEENWDFWQKLPQLLFVLVANHIIEVYLCYLSMTDSVIYEIKSLSKKPNNSKNIIDLIDCMKTKLIIFFISTFILFLGFWYFISAFCAVYQNTQKIFIRDSALSFATSLLDPFLIYGLTMILRRISLSVCCRKRAGCLYKISDIIPIF